MIKKLLLTAGIAITTLAFAQKPVDVKLYLRDGNTISGTTSLNDVVLKTEFGQLTIPVQKVNNVVVGTGKDKAVKDKVIPYLKVLNSNASDDMKKAAYDDLIKSGIKAIAAINEFLADPKNLSEIETPGEYTIDNALTEIKNTFGLDEFSQANDVVTIDNEYTMGGSYDFMKLDVKTEYGNLSIPKEKIKSMEISYMEPGNGDEMVFKLMANKHISGNQTGGWLKTGIVLKKGQKFSIVASGEVMLASLSNQKYKPDGSYVASNGTSYPSVTNDEYSTTNTYPTYGNVVYKIGDTSYESSKAGAKYSGIANASGMLMISIYETVYNPSNTGSYTVKISLK